MYNELIGLNKDNTAITTTMKDANIKDNEDNKQQNFNMLDNKLCINKIVNNYHKDEIHNSFCNKDVFKNLNNINSLNFKKLKEDNFIKKVSKLISGSGVTSSKNNYSDKIDN